MATKYFGSNDFTTFLLKLKDYLTSKYVLKETGKGLSTNDFTDEYKTKVDNAGESSFSGEWDDLTGTAPAVSTFENDVDYISQGEHEVIFGKTSTSDYVPYISDGTTLSEELLTSKKAQMGLLDSSGDFVGGLVDDLFDDDGGIQMCVDQLRLNDAGNNGYMVEPIDYEWFVEQSEKPTSDEIDTKITTAVTGLATEEYVNNKITGVYTIKGSCTTSGLPTTDQVKGDVWNLTDAGTYGPAGTNVVWDGTAWDALGGVIELSEMTSDEITTIWDGVFNV